VPDGLATGGVARRHHEHFWPDTQISAGEEDQKSLLVVRISIRHRKTRLPITTVSSHVAVGHDTPGNAGDYSAL
jgi:hypothetical protein